MSWTPLVGHDDVLTQLRNALAKDRLGHAFLFAGPDGIGKRRTARHIAQGLLCKTNDAILLDPCGRCPDCVQVRSESHPDFFQISKPDDRMEMPIARVQELVGNLSLKPARGARKIAILDDADALNEESANCFLKTLEEPPAGSLLILIATSPETQLATILSRCQVLRFNPLSDDQVAGLLLELGVCEQDADAQVLAARGAGSGRLAMDLADPQWIEIRERTVKVLAGDRAADYSPFGEELHRFIEDAGKDAASRRQRGRQAVRLAASFYRECLRVQCGQAPVVDEPALAQLAERVSTQTLLDLTDRCLQADYHIARYLNQRLAIECWLDDLSQIASGAYVEPIDALHVP